MSQLTHGALTALVAQYLRLRWDVVFVDDPVDTCTTRCGLAASNFAQATHDGFALAFGEPGACFRVSQCLAACVNRIGASVDPGQFDPSNKRMYGCVMPVGANATVVEVRNVAAVVRSRQHCPVRHRIDVSRRHAFHAARPQVGGCCSEPCLSKSVQTHH